MKDRKLKIKAAVTAVIHLMNRKNEGKTAENVWARAGREQIMHNRMMVQKRSRSHW